MGRSPLALAVILMAACASEKSGLRELEGGIEIGLRRGGAWTTVTVRPPHMLGPQLNLKLQKGVFTGSIHQRPINLKVEGEGVSGMGPAGAVAVEVYDESDVTVIEGKWNGSRVHFRVTPNSMRGTIAIVPPPGFGGNINSGLGVYQPGFADAIFCQYVLDRIEANGGRGGTSTCQGMPEDTVVEIPRTVEGWLSRQEMAVLLLALLSSPPRL